MSTNPKIHQTIDTIMVDIPHNYGICLSRYWSAMLNGCYSIGWSHLWIPFNRKLDHIKIYREGYIKHVVTDLNDPNEPVMFNNLILGNYSYDAFLGNYTSEISHFGRINTQYEILHYTQIVKPNCDMVDNTNITYSVLSNTISKDILEIITNSINPNN